MRTSVPLASSFVAVVAMIASTTLGTNAYAQAQGAFLSRFDPSERGSRFFVADSLELHPDARGSSNVSGDNNNNRPLLAVGIPVSFAHRARTFGGTGEGERSRLVENALYLHPGASVAISPGARFAMDIPVAALQTGEDTNLAGSYYLAPPTSPRLGDVRASFDLRLYDSSSPPTGVSDQQDEEPPKAAAVGRHFKNDQLTLAAGVRAWLPTGSSAAFSGEETTRFGIHVSTATQLGYVSNRGEVDVLVALRVGYMYRREGNIGSTAIGAEMNAALGIAWVSKDRLWTIGPEIYGATLIDRFFKTRNTPIEILGGVHRSLGSFRAGVGVGSALVGGLGSAHLRGVVSLEWFSSPPPSSTSNASVDRDQDGVPDHEDACPDVPGERGGVSGSSGVASGCPRPPRDRDGDGIIDGDDACPLAPGIQTRDRRTHGCPDADRDGIPDAADACPTSAGEASKNGCPSDADGDGVPDSQDACPDVAGVRTDSLETNGCPAPSDPTPTPTPTPTTPSP